MDDFYACAKCPALPYYAMGGYGGTGDKDDLDNHSDQMNPNNDEYSGD